MTYTMKSRAAGLVDEAVFAPDELAVAVKLAEKRTLVAGSGALLRGAVLGKITASGKLTLSLSAAADGSQTPYCVLAEDITVGGADADAVVYMEATLNQNKLVFGTGHTAATVYDALRTVDIHLVKAMAY